ncbi:MAG: iron transporter [Oscillospiraceae bacterium]|jgi:uncharacterized protein involved in high-affinity Fe2+ transport|nr:iron transporter [Oscillospiraceae bacterium]
MKHTKLFAWILAAVLMAALLAACANQPAGGKDDDQSGAPVAPGDVAGFEEFPIGDDLVLGPLNVAAVYFQPVDMEPASGSLPASEADMHIEADISAAEGNDLGYGVGDFVPWLQVSYTITREDGTVASEGNFMPMSASDGPHYGANIKLGEAGDYKVKFTIESPEGQGYLLHVDPTTGVPGRFWTTPLVAEWDFAYVPHEW